MERLLLLCLLGLLQGKVTVYSPESLKEEVSSKYPGAVVPSSLANFGNPPYGSKMIGKVYLPENKKERSGCKSLHSLNFTGEWEEEAISPIVIVDRGSCSFAQKVRHAQDIGAKAVLVVDNIIEDNVENAILVDDGSGGDIAIPSFLLAKEEGDLIKKTARKEEVILILTFELGNKTESIDVSLWLTAGHKPTLDFIVAFSPEAQAFPVGSIRFHPRHVFWFCTECQKKDNYSEARANCLSGGRYCSIDPDDKGPLDGRAIIYEDLRQSCVANLTKAKGLAPWFQYVSAVATNCYTAGLKEECAYKAMTDIVEVKAVKKCVNDSFTGSNHLVDDNSVLKKEKNHWVKNSPGFFPAIHINKALFKGDFEVDEVLLALCSSFTTPPANCYKVIPQEVEKVSFVALVMTILAVLGGLAGVLILYRLWMRKEMQSDMRHQVNSAVSEYMALTGDERRRAFS